MEESVSKTLYPGARQSKWSMADLAQLLRKHITHVYHELRTICQYYRKSYITQFLIREVRLSYSITEFPFSLRLSPSLWAIDIAAT